LPDTKRALSLAPSPSDAALAKPQPPDDLWAQMDKVLTTISPESAPFDASWLTIAQMAEKYDRSTRWAEAAMEKALKAGLVEKRRGCIDGHVRTLFRAIAR
jgi:hypothetical protein